MRLRLAKCDGDTKGFTESARVFLKDGEAAPQFFLRVANEKLTGMEVLQHKSTLRILSEQSVSSR